MSIKNEVRKLLWNVGIDISRFEPTSHDVARRKQLIESYQIDTFLDIGANSGQSGVQLRKNLGYTGRILSFEPLSSAFALLQANAKDDPAWQIFNIALGDAQEKVQINIAQNSESSSLLDMLPSHLKSAPQSGLVGKEEITVKTLDSIFDDVCKGAKNIYMKVDTQGYEAKVLAGAKNSLPVIDTIQMEMSLIPLYEGEMLMIEKCILMRDLGYTLVAIENGFSDPKSGQLLQVDGIFHRLRA